MWATESLLLELHFGHFAVNVLTSERMFGILVACWGRGAQPSRN